MLPVIDNSSAIIKSAEDATQYAPDVPMSLITATTGLFAASMASAISLDAMTVPPGEFIINIIALMLLFVRAFSKFSRIDFVEGCWNCNGDWILVNSPSIFIIAISFLSKFEDLIN